MTAQYKAASQRAQSAPRLVFYGDSITEAWRGTDTCLPCSTDYRTGCAGLPALFDRLYGRYRAAAMGIAGDQVANLVWRLQNGQLPPRHPPKVAVLLIGTNDLGAAASGKSGRTAARALAAAVPGVANRIAQAVGVLRRAAPAAHVVVLGLLPRGTGSGDVTLPLGQNNHTWPSAFTPALTAVNLRLRKLAARDGTGKLHFLDCTRSFLSGRSRGRARIDATLMPDALHPSLDGYKVLARCMDGLLRRLL